MRHRQESRQWSRLLHSASITSARSAVFLATPGAIAVDARDTTPSDSPQDAESLRQQVRTLQERLAFYEGFDQLIHDNVAHARELFRLAAGERQAAADAINRVRLEDRQREAALRGELAAIAAEIDALAAAVDALGRRVARALGDGPSDRVVPPVPPAPRAIALVVHGVPSARTALSLQRFVGSLPQVTAVAAREFAGGVLRLDVQSGAVLTVDQFQGWEDPRRIEPLTERPDVLELSLQPALVARVGA